ncbi:dephospho-CoA kinase [Flavihumibacter profundi]|uniref:dephospho-CoA kinase n=1 Tax=Flavihumibacter profundi TaxID=2716883 RepID=UPI001CC82C8F|nr:dephospho-CoA kinase [Flavihumibacter profundi]MBZ5855755.1 dephospho-CoA kinase [Flavihumibacter profundi]
MLRVGITGGIGSGKSIVARVFNSLGIPVYNADTAAKRLMENDPELVEAIKAQFGDGAYLDGKLNRAYLAQVVFKDKQQLDILNQLVHPVTIRDAEQWMQHQSSPYALKEAALIFESGSQAQLDLVIGVSAPQHIRIHRVMQRDGVSREEVIKRIDNQLSETIKMRLCDYIIMNDDQRLVVPQVLKVHEELLQRAGMK